MRSRMPSLVLTALLAGAGPLWAQTQAPTPSPQSTPGMGQHMMGGSMMGEKSEGGAMMEECKAMMAKHHAMMDKMKAMDTKLDSLVKSMNEAKGTKKIDATAAVVGELVAQRKAMRETMESMMPMMMQHMMKHMQMGMMKGMAASMADCPMMGGSKPAESGHEMHH